MVERGEKNAIVSILYFLNKGRNETKRQQKRTVGRKVGIALATIWQSAICVRSQRVSHPTAWSPI